MFELNCIFLYAGMDLCGGNVGIRNRLRGKWRKEGVMRSGRDDTESSMA